MLPHDIPLDQAAVLSTSFKGILYGVSLSMFGVTIWVLFSRDATKKVNWMMVIVASAFLILSTAHLIVDIVRVNGGLVKYRDTYPGGPCAWFGDITQITFIAKAIIYGLQTLVGDGVVVYRCYIVWKSFWIVIIPIISMLGVAAGSVGATVTSSQATTYADNIFFKRTGQWVILFYSTTIITNFLATGLLAFRIWTTIKMATDIRVNKPLLTPVLTVIIDAGLLYSVTLLAGLICFALHSNGQFIIIDIACPVISIAFYMIIIRLGIQKSALGRHSLGLTTLGDQGQNPRHSSYGAKSIGMHISQLTENAGQ